MLQIRPQVPGSAAVPALVLPPVAWTSVIVTAAITGDTRYDQANPPPLLLRILSSAGGVEVDVNSPDAAVSQDPEANQRQAKWGELLCELLKIHELPNIWRQIPFKDPIPFSRLNRVIERLDVHLTGVATGEGLLGLDVGDRVLVTGLSQRGAVDVIVADERAPAVSHRFPQVAIVRESAGVERSLRGRDEGIGMLRGETLRPRLARTSDQQLSLIRTLYVGRSAIPLFTSIRDVMPMGNHLVLTTEYGVITGRVGHGNIDRWKRLSVESPQSIAQWTTDLAVGTDTALLLYTKELELILRRPGRVVALATSGEHLALSDGSRLWVLGRERGKLHTLYKLNMPGIRKLLSVGGGVFALGARRVWRLTERTLVDTEVQADELIPFHGDQVAAVRAGQVTILDQVGVVTMEFTRMPWLANVLEWPHTSVEVNRRVGTLTIFDRFVTFIDSAEAQQRLPDLDSDLSRC